MTIEWRKELELRALVDGDVVAEEAWRATAPPSPARSLGAPEPLRREMPGPEPFPLLALGEVLEPAARALRETVQAPDAVIAGALLAAASLAVQGLADVEAPDGRRIPLSLWLISISESGERKSSADREAMRGIDDYERMLEREYAHADRRHAAEMAEWEARCSVAKNRTKGAGLAAELLQLGDKPQAPSPPYRRVADFTAEGLFRLLNAGVPSVGVFSDEAALVFGGHGMSQESVMRTAGTLCKLWDHGALDRVRSGDGALRLRGRRLALHLMAQPVIAGRALSDPVLLGQGFLARCLLAQPLGTAGTRMYVDAPIESHPAMVRLRAILLARLQAPFSFSTDDPHALAPPAVLLSSRAFAIWRTFHDVIERGMLPEGQFADVRPWGSKAAEQALRLAGVLRLMTDQNAATLDELSVGRGCQIALWYLCEVQRILASTRVSQDVQDAEAILAWAQARGDAVVTVRALLQYGPGRLRDRNRITVALARLTEAGHVVRLGGAELAATRARRAWRLVLPEESGA
ncbi:DUF3987 domain-containing protein [Lysobacter sp. MMG2]|uniref:DUF3987 domain-containing protein n=1 Tax=Lysobacter sp. MMG2 TaxID=2801338 RepID=UPI001C24D808|nr:DUF3987 domain-containing protein [Lysobacter sp. MMG2]MBU8974787.1 DUF3987 domain-containing protein [Lysobacter sp. MMG2]